MARIRSIKPEFFTSETLAVLPISARLTFIGLWTYVDDNGVGQDNERLIMAALYPLDDDLLESLQRTREDLRSLSGAGVLQRYTVDGKRFLYVRSWTEHQKVSHPRASRYPTPLTCTDTNPPEDSGNPPEPLRPEQGAGSREQGAGNIGLALAVPHQEPPQARNSRGRFVAGGWVNTPRMCPAHQDQPLSDHGTCRGCEADRKASA